MDLARDNELRLHWGLNYRVLQDLIDRYKTKGLLSEVCLVVNREKFLDSIERRFDWMIHLSQIYVGSIHLELCIYYVGLIRFNFIASSNYTDEAILAYPIYEGG